MQPDVVGQFSDIDRTALVCEVPEDRVPCRITQRAGLELLRAHGVAIDGDVMEVTDVWFHRSTSGALGA
jgi:hypothetical protein